MAGVAIDPLCWRGPCDYMPDVLWTIDASVFFLATRELPDNVAATMDYYLDVLERDARRLRVRLPFKPREAPERIADAIAIISSRGAEAPRRLTDFNDLLARRRDAALRAGYVMYTCIVKYNKDDKRKQCYIPSRVDDEIHRSPHAANITARAFFKYPADFWRFYKEYYIEERERARDLLKLVLGMDVPGVTGETKERVEAAAEALRAYYRQYQMVGSFLRRYEVGYLANEIQAVHALGAAMGLPVTCDWHGGGWTYADASIIVTAVRTGTKVATGDRDVANVAYALGIPVMYAYGRPRLPPRTPGTRNQHHYEVKSPCDGSRYRLVVDWSSMRLEAERI